MVCKWTIRLSGLFLLLAIVSCKRVKPSEESVLPFSNVDSTQVDIVLAGMNLEEKIGQLILWEAPAQDSVTQQQLFEKASAGLVGGVLLKNLPINIYLNVADSLRRSAKLPLFFGSDEKVSLHNQFAGLKKLPTPISVAAIDSLAIDSILVAKYVQECKALGINITFAPTIKSAVDSKQTVDYQAFGADTLKIRKRYDRFYNSLSSQNLLAVADDFSKMAFVQNDSLRRVAMYEYVSKIEKGLGGLLVADELFEKDTLNKLMPNFLKVYLERYLKFKGLMVVKIGAKESPEQKLLAGADLLVTTDASKIFRTVERLLLTDKLTERELDQRVRRILLAKAWVNGGKLPVKLSIVPHDSLTSKPVKFVSISEKRQPKVIHVPKSREPDFDVKVDNIGCYFEDPHWGFFIDRMFENTVVLARDEQHVLPFKNMYESDYQIFKCSGRNFREFETLFSKYANFKLKDMPLDAAGELSPIVFTKTEKIPTAIVILDSIDLQPGFHRQFIESINQAAGQAQVVVVNFGNPKNLKYFANQVACIQIFEKNKTTEGYAAQLLFGGVAASGTLPLKINESLGYGAGIHQKPVRLAFGEAENVGIASEKLVDINAIAESAIDNGVFPGCQVAIAKDGQVIFSESFGHFTYSKTSQPLQNKDLFDIASLTKVSATTLAAMKLVENKQLDLEGMVSDYLSVPTGSAVGNIKIKQLLLHQSGLQAQMPLSRFFSGKNVPAKGCNDYFCRKRKGAYSVKVADGLYFRKTYQDTILKRVFNLPVNPNPRFRYSDVNFYLLYLVVQNVTKLPMDKYLAEQVYHPLGLHSIGFNPLERFPKSRIVPTEQDNYWRKTLVQGTVHDPCVALFGGVGGSAGIFSNAEDLAVLFQMMLADGQYGGVQLFEKSTVENFIAKQNANNHRGLGFDKPTKRKYPTYSPHVSSNTYGHTGFTGTCAWVDPERKLVFVFLSNRVNPSSRNGKIFTENVRSRIHEVVYDAMGSYENTLPEIETEEEIELEEGAGG